MTQFIAWCMNDRDRGLYLLLFCFALGTTLVAVPLLYWLRRDRSWFAWAVKWSLASFGFVGFFYARITEAMRNGSSAKAAIIGFSAAAIVWFTRGLTKARR